MPGVSARQHLQGQYVQWGVFVIVGVGFLVVWFFFFLHPSSSKFRLNELCVTKLHPQGNCPATASMLIRNAPSGFASLYRLCKAAWKSRTEGHCVASKTLKGDLNLQGNFLL